MIKKILKWIASKNNLEMFTEEEVLNHRKTRATLRQTTEDYNELLVYITETESLSKLQSFFGSKVEGISHIRRKDELTKKLQEVLLKDYPPSKNKGAI